MPNIRFIKMVFAAAFLLADVGAEAGPFTNGSFEVVNRAAIASGTWVNLIPGDTWLTGWTVGGPGGGDVEVANGPGDGINPYDGQQLVVFNAGNTSPGGVLSQTFTTTVGQSYGVSFAVAEGGSGGGVSLTATALASNGSVLASNYCAPTSGAWVLRQMTFTAASTNTTLVFTDTSSATISVDLLFDDVTVTANQASGPTIVTSPVSQSVAAGTQATFAAAASGNPTGVQWYLINYQGSNAIAGATGTTLTVTASGPAAGGYFAIFSNAAGSATTSTANLAVTGLVFTNGSFETAVISGGQGVMPGSSLLPGWTPAGLGTPVALYHGSAGGLGPEDGQQWIAFGGVNEPSGDAVCQTITTVVGMSYNVTYYVGESGSGGTLSFTGTAFDALGHLLASNRCVPVSGAWTQCQMSFMAATTNTTLVFTDTPAVDVYGVATALDAITVVTNGTAAPVVTTSPLSQSVAAGTQVSFTAAASGSASTVQWYLISYQGSNAIAGATNTTLTVTASGPTAGGYIAVFSNSAGSATTSTATLAVTGLVFTNGSFENPVVSGGQGVSAGTNSLPGWTVGGAIVGIRNGTTGGLGPYDGQQVVYFGGINVASGCSVAQTFSTVAGTAYVATYYVGESGTGNLNLTGTTFDAVGNLLASNRCVSVSGAWTQCQMNFTATSADTTVLFTDTSVVDVLGGAVAVDAVTVVVKAGSAPVVTTSPLSQSVAAGTQVSFTAAASGSASTVQWYLINYQGSNAIAGATNTTLTVTASGPTAGGYIAVFSNSAGSATTSTATLAVTGLVFTNGSFENPVVSGGQGVSAGTNSLPGWTVGGAIVGIRNGTTGGLGPYDGQQVVYFGGINVASGCSVAQTFSTVAGTAYVATYYVGESGTGNLNLTGTTFDAVGNLLASNRCVSVSGAWTQCQMNFTATSADTTVLFTDTSVVDVLGGAVAVDAVTVVVKAGSAPVVTTSPLSQSVAAGTQVSFTAAASGSASTVQWYLVNYQGSNSIAGATGTTLTVTASGPTAGGYIAVFSNSAGSATTSTATLAVTGLVFTNGSFENPVVSGGQGVSAGTTSLPGWTVRGAVVGLWHGTTGGLSPYEGQQFVYFGGINVASGYSVAQTITTVVGTPYVVTYYVGESGSGNLNVTGTAFGAFGNLLASNRCVAASGVWTPCQMSFTATSANTTVVFTDTSVVDVLGGAVAVDAVTVVAWPTAGLPVIMTSPVSQMANSGATVSFSAIAAGSPSTLQWYLGTNAVAAPSGTNSPLTVTASDGTAGNYTAVFSNSYGTATSAVAVLTVIDPPVITRSPASQVVVAGTPVTFTASASGSPSTVQWYFGTSAISGAATTNLTFTAFAASAGNYSAKFSNAAGTATSALATLTVNAGAFTNGSFEIVSRAPIPTGPGTVINPGDSWLTGWTVGGPGGGDIIVVNGPGDGINPYDGQQMIVFNADNKPSGGILSQTIATTVGQSYGVSYAVAMGGSGGGVSLTCTARASNGSVLASNYCAPTSGAWVLFQMPFTAVSTNTTLVFTDASSATLGVDLLLDGVTVLLPPVIVTSPASRTNLVGTTATFTASAAGGPTSVQWFHGSSPIANATNTTLSFTVNTGSGGNYTAVFSNAAGSATTAVAVLTVSIPVYLTQQPQSITTNVGATVTLTGAADGTAPITYQWRLNGTNIQGATNTSLVLTNAQPASAGSYSLVVSNPYGTNTSTNAVLAFISTLQVVSASVAGSSTVTIPVNLMAAGNEGALRFSLNFDPAVLTFKSIKAGSGAGGASFVPNTNNAGIGQVGVLVGYFSSTFPQGTLDVADVTFAAGYASNPVLTTISFGDTPAGREIIDTNFNLLAGAYVAGTLTISQTGLKGDVWPQAIGDYQVDVRDWAQEGRVVAGLNTVSNASEFGRADCAPRNAGGDGVVDALDLAQVGRYAVGLDPVTPVGWTAGSSPGVVKPQAPRPLDGTINRTLSIVPLTNAANSVMVQLLAAGDENTVDFSVTFDPTILRLASATQGAGISLFVVNSNEVAAGHLGIVLALSGGQAFAAGANQIATLVFNAVSYSNQATLAFGDAPVLRSVADVTASFHLPASYQSGSLAVGGAAWPQLAISQSAGGIVLSWPSSATVLNAQWSSSLSANWTNTGGAPATNGGTVFLTLPAPTNTTYYRLAQP